MQSNAAKKIVVVHKAVAVPVAVKVEGNRILWRRDEDAPRSELGGFIEGADPERTIWEFLELRTASPEQFTEFATNYGVLGIRKDGLPGIAPDRVGVSTLPVERLQDDEGLWYVENMSVWRMYSIGLRAALAAAMEVRDHVTPEWPTFTSRWGLSAHTWDSLGMPQKNTGEDEVPETYLRWTRSLSPDVIVGSMQSISRKYRRRWLSNFISDFWVRNGNSVPQLSWPDDEDHMALELSTEYMNLWPVNSLFSVVVSQMTDILTSEKFGRMTQCSICGRLFMQQIKTGRHDRAYCDEHKIEAQREKKRRWARKNAAKKKANATF